MMHDAYFSFQVFFLNGYEQSHMQIESTSQETKQYSNLHYLILFILKGYILTCAGRMHFHVLYK